MDAVAGAALASELYTPLARGFYGRPTHEVARDLIGALLLREDADGLCGGRIVETEAYGGPDDRASHARAGRTMRTRPMFGPAGHAYVYLVYGMHECLNVVAHGGSDAGAVLLRAIEPLVGVERMRSRRGRPADPDWRLAAGPARLCQALAVGRAFDAHDLTAGDQLWLAAPSAAAPAAGRAWTGQVESGTRIGVDYAGDEWVARPWRFWAAGHPSVSR